MSRPNVDVVLRDLASRYSEARASWFAMYRSYEGFEYSFARKVQQDVDDLVCQLENGLPKTSRRLIRRERENVTGVGACEDVS